MTVEEEAEVMVVAMGLVAPVVVDVDFDSEPIASSNCLPKRCKEAAT